MQQPLTRSIFNSSLSDAFKPKSGNVIPLSKSCLKWVIPLRGKARSYNGLMRAAHCACGPHPPLSPLQTLLCSLLSRHTGLLTISQHVRHLPALDPLLLLFPLPGILFPQTCKCLALLLLYTWSNGTFVIRSTLNRGLF